jgi:hypothetical protein
MQRKIINAGAEARERGLLQQKQSAKEVWERYTDIPDVEQDVPSLDDVVQDQAEKDGEPIGPDLPDEPPENGEL